MLVAWQRKLVPHTHSALQVHLILRHKSPKGVIEEKHLKSPPLVLLDKKTHVYTAIIKPDNSCATPGRVPWADGLPAGHIARVFRQQQSGHVKQLYLWQQIPR